MIEHLPLLSPDSTRSARTRARCHDVLERRQADARDAARYVVERNALLGFGAVYLSSLAFAILQVLISR